MRMKLAPFLALAILLLFCGAHAQAATQYATCPSAAAGDAFGAGSAYPSCGTGPASYLAVSAMTATTMVADLRVAAGSWQPASAVRATDQVFGNVAVNGGNWTPAGALGFPILAPPPTPPPVSNPPAAPVLTSYTFSVSVTVPISASGSGNGGSSSAASLFWTAPTQDIANNLLAGATALTGFNIYQGPSASSLVRVATTPASATSYAFTGLAPGTYSLTVTALNAQGESAQPAPVQLTVGTN